MKKYKLEQKTEKKSGYTWWIVKRKTWYGWYGIKAYSNYVEAWLYVANKGCFYKG